MYWKTIVVGMMAMIASSSVAQDDADDSQIRAYAGRVIDVHLHAYPADGNGPAPNFTCVGMSSNLQHDMRRPWVPQLLERQAKPPCEDPIKGPATDAEVRDGSIALMRKYDVVGILSADDARWKDWSAAEPERFWRGQRFSLSREKITPDELGSKFDAGGFDVLAEVTNQYAGYMADDPAMDPYWALAAEKDIPVGIHIGLSVPGVTNLYPEFAIQGPMRLEPILKRHPNLRVYVMHAGYPFIEEMKAMLFIYPQLHVEVGVLQMGPARKDYYAFLQELVQAGFIDRIMFGSDQMNWPGMISEGIDAINEAPFLTYEQKKDILHDNAVRFFRLRTDASGQALLPKQRP